VTIEPRSSPCQRRQINHLATDGVLAKDRQRSLGDALGLGLTETDAFNFAMSTLAGLANRPPPAADDGVDFASRMSALAALATRPPRSLADVLGAPAPALSPVPGAYDRLMSPESEFAAFARTLFPAPTRLALHWHRCKGDVWGGLSRVDLAHPHFTDREGVYVIWSSNGGRCVRVGQGNIRKRLTEHRADPEIALHRPVRGELLVTWADVDSWHRNGVERFLGEELSPLVGNRFPDAPRIEVNLPR